MTSPPRNRVLTPTPPPPAPPPPRPRPVSPVLSPVRPPRRSRSRSCSRVRSRSRSLLERPVSPAVSPRTGSALSSRLFPAPRERDASPVRLSTSREEPDEADRVSFAQYELFRQAVQSSKAAFQAAPAAVRRATQVSLLDLGDEDCPERVTWKDQPSMMRIIQSAGRLAQGLLGDEVPEPTP